MAKRKNAAPVRELASWDEVDRALREICECEIGIEKLESDMNMKINDAKAEAEKLGKPLKTAIGILTEQIQSFVEGSRAEMEGKSKFLNFGTVGFRQSTSISYSTKKTEKIIEALKQFGMLNCITVKETINKEALKLYPERDIVKVGAAKKVEDRFYCETDHEKLKG